MEAEVAIICYSQRQRFSEKIYALSSRKATVSRQSSIYRLDPILEDKLLRVGGKLSKGVMPEEVKHQLILSKDQHVLCSFSSMYTRIWVMVDRLTHC